VGVPARRRPRQCVHQGDPRSSLAVDMTEVPADIKLSRILAGERADRRAVESWVPGLYDASIGAHGGTVVPRRAPNRAEVSAHVEGRSAPCERPDRRVCARIESCGVTGNEIDGRDVVPRYVTARGSEGCEVAAYVDEPRAGIEQEGVDLRTRLRVPR